MAQTTKNGRNDHEIIASISRRQWLLKLLQLLLFLCVIGAFLGIVSGALIWERDYQKGICRCVAGVICIVGGVLLAKGNKKLTHSLKVQIGEYVVHDILAEKVAITEYAPDQHIGRSFVDSCSILPNYDRISGSDYISGTYRDVPFRYCDLLLERKTQERDGMGIKVPPIIPCFRDRFCAWNLVRSWMAMCASGRKRIRAGRRPFSVVF